MKVLQEIHNQKDIQQIISTEIDNSQDQLRKSLNQMDNSQQIKQNLSQNFVEEFKNISKPQQEKYMIQIAKQQDNKATIKQSPNRSPNLESDRLKVSDKKTTASSSQLQDILHNDNIQPPAQLVQRSLQHNVLLPGNNNNNNAGNDNIETPAFNSPSNIYYSIQNFLDPNDRQKFVVQQNLSTIQNQKSSNKLSAITSQNASIETSMISQADNQSNAIPPRQQTKKVYNSEFQNSEQKPREYLVNYSNNKENQSYRSQSPSCYKWSDSNSPAIASALKKLQDKIKLLEKDNNELKMKLRDNDGLYEQKINRLTEEFQVELNKNKDTDMIFQDRMNKYEEDLQAIQKDNMKLQKQNAMSETENKQLRTEINKKQELITELQKQILYLQKCNQIIEDEKSKHLEQNVLEKEQIEDKLTTLEKINAADKSLIEQLENQIESQQKEKQLLDQKVDSLMKEFQLLQQKVATSDQQTLSKENELKNTIQKLEKEGQQMKDKLEKEKQIIQKRQQLNNSQEEKIKQVQDENLELKKQVKASLQDIQKKNQQLEHYETQMQKHVLEKQSLQDNFKLLKQINEELTSKIQQDCPAKLKDKFNSIIVRAKKLDESRFKSSVASFAEKSSKKSGSKSGQKSAVKKSKSRSKSKHATRSNSQEKNKMQLGQNKPLDIEDLNMSNSMVESRSSRIGSKIGKSSKKVSKNSTQQLTSEEIEIQNTPKCLSSFRGTKTDQKKQGMLSKRSSSKKTNKQSGEKAQTTDREKMVTLKQNKKNTTQTVNESEIQKDTQTDTFRTLNEFNVQSLIENTNRHVNIDKMNENEVSSEIVKNERELIEMKREYKNFLAKSQENQEVEVDDQIRMKLNELANEMPIKSEFLAQLKKRQRDLVSQSFSKQYTN